MNRSYENRFYMAKSSLRFFITLLNTIIVRVQEGSCSLLDYTALISKFEEKLYPLIKMMFDNELDWANQCFENEEPFETIEEYLMVFLCMLLVRGFFEISKDQPEFEGMHFDLNVDASKSANLETCVDFYPFELMEALEEHIRVKETSTSNKINKSSQRGQSEIRPKPEDEFPDYNEDTPRSELEDSESPRFNNLYNNQNTREFQSKETFGRSDINNYKKQSTFGSKISQSRLKSDAEVLLAVEDAVRKEEGEKKGKYNRSEASVGAGFG